MNIQRKIVMRGKVQGVGFRNATWRKAMELGIRGSVRNLDDGSVEILASATDKEFIIFENWCREGPFMQGWTALKFLNWIKQALQISALMIEIFINRFKIKKRLN